MKGLETPALASRRRECRALKALTRYEGFGNGAVNASKCFHASVEGTDPL